MYLRILYKIHVFRFMSQHLCISRILCKIHVNVSGFMSQHRYISGSSACLSIHQFGSSTRSTSVGSCLSIFVSQAPLQDPCLRIHPYVSQDPLQDPCPRIHVLAFMSQHPFISQDPLQDPCLRSLSIFVPQDSLQDPCLRIHVSASTNMDPLQDPRLWAHVSASLYLRLLCKSHVSGSVYKHPYVSQDPLQDPCLRIRI